MEKMIPFNKPYLSGNELEYIKNAVELGQLSGNGFYTKKCHAFFEKKYGFKKALLTTSCTAALEMCAMLVNLKSSDEVIIPSFTFVSTALAFVRQGARVVFADSSIENPNINALEIESLITNKTKAIVIVHYAGIACDMDIIMEIAIKYNIIVIEDAAQSIDSYYKGKRLGTIGHLSTFSFHETKNISSGEGGLIGINDIKYINRAEIIWEKGTNRADFFRGNTSKYEWIDIGSSFLPSELNAAYLWAQLENLTLIQNKRIMIWNYYRTHLEIWALKNNISLMKIPEYATNNGHMFYLICDSISQRRELIEFLKSNETMAVSHYLSLHSSPFYTKKHDGRILRNSDFYTNRLLRLPLFYELNVEKVVDIIKIFN